MVLTRNNVVVDVKVKDVRRALSFYNTMLGLKKRVVSTTWASLQAKNVELHLNKHWGARAGIEFFVKDIGGVVRKLKAKGVKFQSRIETHSWGKIAYFKDSEGNTLSLVEERR